MKRNVILLDPSEHEAVGLAEQPATAPVVVEQAATEAAAEDLNFVDPESGETELHVRNDEGEPFVQREGFKLVLVGFAGKELKDLGYYVKQFDSVSAAVEKHGEKPVLDALNEQIRLDVRRNVKRTRIPKFDDDKATTEAIKKLAQSQPILFNKSDAEKFVPGERELSSNQIMALLKKKQGDNAPKDEIKALIKKLTDTIMRERSRQGVDDDDE